MYKWGGVVTDRPVDGCCLVFRRLVGRAAWRRRVVRVDVGPGAVGGTLMLAVHTGGLDLVLTVHNRGTDRRVVLEVRSGRPATEVTAIRLIGRLVAAFVPVEPGPWPPPPALHRGDPLVELLGWAGRAAVAPWNPVHDDPDQTLDRLLTTIHRMTDPRALLRRWCRGGLGDDGLVMLGVAALVAHHPGPARDDPGWHRLLDASLGFLRASYVDRARVPSWAWDHYLATGGGERGWLEPRPGPESDPEPPTPLGDDEVRLLAVTGPGSRVLVTCRGAGYVALDDTDGEDEGLLFTLSERDDLYDCYEEAAWATPYRAWAQAELEPFFPVPRPAL